MKIQVGELRKLIQETILMAEAPAKKVDKVVDQTSKPWWPIVQMIRKLNPQDKKALSDPERGNYVVVYPDKKMKRDPMADAIVRDVLFDIYAALYDIFDSGYTEEEKYEAIDKTWNTLFKDVHEDLIVATLKSMLKKDEEKAKFTGKISAKAAEAPPDGPIGQIAFGEERVDDVPPEPNTELEKKLLRSLDYYIGNHRKMKFSPEELEIIQGILSSGLYKKIFRSPKGIIYRGIALTRKQFEKQFPDLVDEVYADTTKRYEKEYRLDGVYVSKRSDELSSWSSDLDVAKRFANDSYYSDAMMKEAFAPVMVIFSAPASENAGHLFDLSNLYSYVKTPNSSLRQAEAETLAFGPINYSSIKLMRRERKSKKSK